MTLKRTYDWKKLYDESNARYSKRIYDVWNDLSQYFGDKKIDIYDLILFAHGTNTVNKTVNYINDIFQSENIQLPKMQYKTEVNVYPELPELLKIIRGSTYSHTVYTYACMRLVMTYLGFSIPDWIDIAIKDVNIESYPKWLATIINRQIALAYQAGFTEDDPLLFVYKWTSMDKVDMKMRSLEGTDPEVLDFLYAFRENSGYDFFEIAIAFKKFAGIKKNGIIQDTGEYVGFKHSNKREVNRPFTSQHALVGIYTLEGNRTLIWDLGYCLYEPEYGLYLINGTKGIYLAPYYLITRPSINSAREKDRNFKENLSKIGYENADFYAKMNSYRQLQNHRIVPHKLQEI